MGHVTLINESRLTQQVGEGGGNMPGRQYTRLHTPPSSHRQAQQLLHSSTPTTPPSSHRLPSSSSSTHPHSSQDKHAHTYTHTCCVDFLARPSYCGNPTRENEEDCCCLRRESEARKRVCCSVCCSVLQWCHVLQYVAVWYIVLQHRRGVVMRI